MFWSFNYSSGVLHIQELGSEDRHAACTVSIVHSTRTYDMENYALLLTIYIKQTWRFTTSLYIATAVSVEWLSTSSPVYLAENRHCHNINDGVYY